jgi:tetratricopeptide (TPR) repeat protein
MNKVFFALLIPALLFATQPTDKSLLFGIELGISEHYNQAIAHFSNIKKDFPNCPAGPFFLSAIYQSRMMDFETNIWKDQFFAEIEITIRLAKIEIKKGPNDPYNYFYLGGALAYKSFQTGREGKYLSAFRSAMSSVSNLKKAAHIDSNFCDAFLGVGSYKYWKSHITKSIDWLPFFSDNRKEGIYNIEQTIECSKFSKWAAISNLSWIYIEENDFENAITYAQKGLAHFPNSRFFLWPLGDAQFKNGEFAKAAGTYTQILNSIQQETFNNGYNEILLHYKLAQCCFNLSNFEETNYWCTNGLKVKAQDKVENRARDIRNKLSKLKNKISIN